MAVEATSYFCKDSEEVIEIDEEIPSGGYKHYLTNPGLYVFASRFGTSKITLDSISDVFAILYEDEKDEEGMILDISGKTIELSQGQEVYITKFFPEGSLREFLLYKNFDGNPDIVPTPNSSDDLIPVFV